MDTADRELIEQWKRKNPHYLTYAFDENDELAGFIGILPLSQECGRLIEAQELREEDLSAEYVLPAEGTPYAQYVYISGIAVRDLNTWKGSQCTAALISAAAGVVRNIYDARYLKAIFANPTTYWGNRIIGKFGLAPLRSTRKSLKAGHDFYGAEATSELMAHYRHLEKRYQRFICDYPWPLSQE